MPNSHISITGGEGMRMCISFTPHFFKLYMMLLITLPRTIESSTIIIFLFFNLLSL